MKPVLLMDFIVNKENKNITVKREFAADLPVVWEAFTNSEILDQWWAPRPWKARTKSMDFREGGRWLYAMVGPAGEEHWAVFQYESIQPQKGFTGTDGFTDAEGNINNQLPQSKWETNFKRVENGSLVTFLLKFQDLKHMETMLEMGFKEGFTMAMEGLDELLAEKIKK